MPGGIWVKSTAGLTWFWETEEDAGFIFRANLIVLVFMPTHGALLALLILMDPTHDESQLLVVAGVHGLALLDAAAVVGLALHVEGDPPQLEDDVPLSLRGPEDSTSESRHFANLLRIQQRRGLASDTRRRLWTFGPPPRFYRSSQNNNGHFALNMAGRGANKLLMKD